MKLTVYLSKIIIKVSFSFSAGLEPEDKIVATETYFGEIIKTVMNWNQYNQVTLMTKVKLNSPLGIEKDIEIAMLQGPSKNLRFHYRNLQSLQPRILIIMKI